MIKVLENLGTQRLNFNKMEFIYKNTLVDIMKNGKKGEKLKSFLLRSGTRQRCLLSLLIFSIVLEDLARELRQ